MLKKLTCFILCLVISASLMPTIVLAKAQELNYTEGERELIYLKYTNQEPMLKALFESTSSQGEEDKVKILRLKEGADYDIQIEGTGYGVMDYTIGFMDENGEYSDFRKFENIKITKQTMIDTVAADSDESVLKIDEDGDGKYDLKLSAEENGYGKEVKTRTWIYIVIGSGVLLLIIDLFITLKMRKKRKER